MLATLFDKDGTRIESYTNDNSQAYGNVWICIETDKAVGEYLTEVCEYCMVHENASILIEDETGLVVATFDNTTWETYTVEIDGEEREAVDMP